MSDPQVPRRQLNSPLVFSSESALTSYAPATVSMPFVRRHVTRRLKAAKAECDRELHRVTNSITIYFEARLRDADIDIDRDRLRAQDGDTDSQLGDLDSVGGTCPCFAPEVSSALPSDNEYSSDGAGEGELDLPRHSRPRTLQDIDNPRNISPLTHSRSSPGSQPTCGLLGPASFRRHNTISWDKPLTPSLSLGVLGSTSPTSSTSMLPEHTLTRKLTNASGIAPPTSWTSGAPSRRLSRSVHMAAKPTLSGQSSRSTSRSRSPLPPFSGHASFSDYNQAAITRRSSRILIDDPVDPTMSALYGLIGVATDIIDMTVAQLTAQPKICESLVQRVQNIGKAWEDNPGWNGRNWYVQVLLAVASLSRVVEWWEAEKQFWNFDDNDTEDEPLLFVTKSPSDDDAEFDNFRLNDDDQARHSMRSASQTKRSREARPKTPAPTPIPLVSCEPAQTKSEKATQEPTDSARVLATERLRLQVETAQSQNIVMELSLDGEHFLWVNHAWRGVVGTEPDELSGTRISDLLSQNDIGVFKEATYRLQEDDSHTVEVRFQLQITPTMERDLSLGKLYQTMEGKGMLMIDRMDGQPSHTMWVVRPIAPPRYEKERCAIAIEPGDLAPEPASSIQASFDYSTMESPSTPLPFSQPIQTEPILCRICECKIPQWYFEKHSETCVETHRLEAEIMECNESISELRNTIRDITIALDRTSINNVAEYRGMPIYRPPSNPIVSSPLQLFRASRVQKFGVKKMQKRLLEQLDDILLVAVEVSMPAFKEQEVNEPVERQRFLSPSSERKITQIRTWSKPTVEDAALTQLVQDAERIMRQKIDTVVRMQNTIRYSEKIWVEWQDKIEIFLANSGEGNSGSGSGSESGSEEGEKQHDLLELGGTEIHDSKQFQVEENVDDYSSTASEYACAGESSDPTPMASSLTVRTVSPTLPCLPHTPSPHSVIPPSASSIPSVSSSETRPMSIPIPTNPINSYVPRQIQNTRSSTPSSVSSPLALAAPIVASNTMEDTMPPMLLDESSVVNPSTPAISSQPSLTSPLTIKTRKSASNLLEPRFVVTPPASPRVAAREGTSGLTREPSKKRSHRRHSIVNPLLSPNIGPISPRQPTAPITRTTTSINDFDIIKPISKGAFGSVFLAKKKATGDYFAIKVLKKADMIAKNQITNVKAERMILMKQAESPFVAKLYFTFQSKDNLYLVMEYLNGGDCAALIKSLGCLPEEWTKNYIAEVVLGLEYLHQRGIIHRDLKPDNLLIDQHGHLKLTDFGLSRIGLLGRQHNQAGLGRSLTRYNSRSRPPSMDSSYLSSPLVYTHDLSTNPGGSYFNQRTTSTSSRPGHSPYLPITDDVSESGSSEPMSGLHTVRNKISDSPLQSFATELTTDLRSHSTTSGGGVASMGEQKFVGTPDYLAPETILGLRGDDEGVDWWALGIITYEFLYGIPPFHAESPERVFENILSGQIEWHEDWVEFSEEARDFIRGLLTLDPGERLGSNGAEEVKAHPFFAGIGWEKVTTTEAAFIPQVTDPESTDYFDPRGAIPQLFQDDDPISLAATRSSRGSPVISSSMPPPSMSVPIANKESTSGSGSDDFGSFSFKNLPILKQANDDVIRKLKTDQMAPLTHALSEPTHNRRKSLSAKIKKPPSVVTSLDSKNQLTNPPSPATSISSIASSPSRTSLPPPTPGNGTHVRKTSEFGALERFKQNYMEDRRNSMPSRLRTASVSSIGDGSGSETWNSSVGFGSQQECYTPPSSVHSVDLRKAPDPTDRAVTCLLAEDNPITAKIIETLLIRLGCRCVVVHDGSEAISVAMGDIKFDCILMDLHMPVLDGEGAARYIRSTNSKNTNTPIIAVSAYSSTDPNELSNVFAASLAKPVQKVDLLAAMRQLGFKTSTMSSNNTKVLATNRPQANIPYAQSVNVHS